MMWGALPGADDAVLHCFGATRECCASRGCSFAAGDRDIFLFTLHESCTDSITPTREANLP